MTTYSKTGTGTVSKSCVQHVLRQVWVDLLGGRARKLVTDEQMSEWIDDLDFMLMNSALDNFQLRLVDEANNVIDAWKYVVRDGTIVAEGSQGGGINFYKYPGASRMKVVICRRSGISAALSQKIDERGWTAKAPGVEFEQTYDRVYTKDGYGVERVRMKGK